MTGRWLRRRLHVHWDRHWQLDGVWRCYQCRCGARRLVLAYANQYGPVPPGWPHPLNRHLQPVDDTGWVQTSHDAAPRRGLWHPRTECRNPPTCSWHGRND